MPKTYRTSRPEINKLFPRGLPAIGVTLIVGNPKSGKTLLVMDIVREVLKTPGDRVLVLCEDPALWQRTIDHANLTARSSFNTDDTAATLTVVDNAQISAPVIHLAQHGPVLITASSLTVQTAFNQTAEVMLRIDRLENGIGKLTVVKSRHEVMANGNVDLAAVLFKVDPSMGFVNQDYQPPVQKSGNVQWVHKKINLMRHILAVDDFVEWCRKVAQHADHLSEGRRHGSSSQGSENHCTYS